MTLMVVTELKTKQKSAQLPGFCHGQLALHYSYNWPLLKLSLKPQEQLSFKE
mgnify:CR=1 FL=1|jgi:hypothetical protein